MQAYGVDEVLANTLFVDVTARYEEDGRFYHTLHHIQNVLNILDTLRPYAVDFTAVQLAAWYHDVIYKPGTSDNEERSAQYAGQMLTQLSIPETTISNVQRMIRATTHKPPLPDDIDCQILLDADLATFASDWDLQEEIEHAIRQEFAFVPENVFREGRQQVLQQFLQRDRIYLTDSMYATHEERARENISRAIATLD